MVTDKRHGPSSDNATATAGKRTAKLWGGFCPFWQSSSAAVTTTTSPSSSATLPSNSRHLDGSNSSFHSSRIAPMTNSKSSSSSSVSFVVRSIFPTIKRLRLDPANRLYFPNEPGKQVRSAVRIKNTSRSHVAFKFQTTAPKSCYMRPPGGILAPGEAIIATVFKFVEHPDNNDKQSDQKSNVKFKIMSLKVTGGVDYVPELFDEQKDKVAVERILRVAFIDPERPTPALEKLKRQLADADAAVEIRKKPPVETGPRLLGEGLIIDEWKERREKYLARQQVEAVDSL